MTLYTSSLFDGAEGVRYRFFTRKNGVSAGGFASLNCGQGIGDDPANVRENMRRIASNLGCGVDKIKLVNQTHSAMVQVIADDVISERPEYADAMVTKRRGVFLGIKTADCAPVLFADVENKIVGAAHAGWRGAVGGVLENTLTAMESLGADRRHIVALIGPCIAPQSYTVKTDMYDEFLAADAQASLYFTPESQGVYRFDLAGYVLSRLERANIGAAEWTGIDTYASEREFFSYRRSQERHEDCGRQLSVIGLIDGSFF